MSFCSLQRSPVTPRCVERPRSMLSRFDVRRPCGFSLRDDELRSRRSPQPGRAFRRFSKLTFAARRASCIAAFHPAMFRYPRIEALVTWSDSIRQAALPALDVLAGQTLHLLRADVSARPKRASRSLGAGLEVPARHQGAVRGRRFARRHSWDFHPSQACSR